MSIDTERSRESNLPAIRLTGQFSEDNIDEILRLEKRVLIAHDPCGDIANNKLYCFCDV